MGLLEAALDACPGDNPYALATVATAAVIKIPDAMIGKFCSFAAETKDVWIRFGTADTVSVDTTAVSTVDGTTKALTVDGDEPHLYVPAGQEVQRRLDAGWTHFAHISAATGGYLRFGVCQGHYGAES